ncbi:MAG: hypothetical protein LUG66_05185 [Clostridiales bacterium]|nr:hypothetical protein [Clostridiales bacterium]
MNRLTKEACGSEIKCEYTYNSNNCLKAASNSTSSLNFGYTAGGKLLFCEQDIDDGNYAIRASTENVLN